MNATEQKALLAILHDGDLLAAIDYVEGACKSSKPKAATPGALKPLPRKKSKADKFLDRPGHLAVAPCGCTLYPDSALQCAACIQARSADACRALIAEHIVALDAFSATLHGCHGDRKPYTSRPPRNRDFMINPHNGYYGERDKFEAA